MAGVSGMLDAYRKCFSKIDLSGPTLLSEILMTSDKVSLLFVVATYLIAVLRLLHCLLHNQHSIIPFF